MTSSNVQLIEQLYESFARRDIARVLGAMDPQVEWTSAEGSIYPDRRTAISDRME